MHWLKKIKLSLKQVKEENTGFLAVVITAVVAVLVAGVLLELGPVISYNIYTSMPLSTLDTATNETVNAVNTSVMNGYSMGTVFPTIIIAVGVISIIIAGFGAYAYSKRGA